MIPTFADLLYAFVKYSTNAHYYRRGKSMPVAILVGGAGRVPVGASKIKAYCVVIYMYCKFT